MLPPLVHLKEACFSRCNRVKPGPVEALNHREARESAPCAGFCEVFNSGASLLKPC
ncbi:MAG: hypothetical protein QW579_04650 [Desulfurococcaceae archaeon]